MSYSIASATFAPTSRKSQGGKGSASDRGSWKKRKVFKDTTRVQKYPYSIDEVKALVKAWITDDELRLSDIEVAPSRAYKENLNLCMYHRHTKHQTKECWTLRRIFKKK